MLPAQEPPPAQPTGAVSFVLLDSVAFAGFAVDFYTGNLGFGGFLTALPLGGSGGTIVFFEPGAYGRYYFGPLDGTFFVTGGVSYWTAAGSGDEEVMGFAEYGHFNINSGLGFHSLFGGRSNTRFTVELGPRYTIPTYDEENGGGFLFLHFMMSFGMTF